MRKTLLLLPLLAACATTSTTGGTGIKRYGATYKLPDPSAIDGDAERSKYSDARNHARLGEVAKDSGNMDQARGEWRSAGIQLGEMADVYKSSEYRLVYRGWAARYLLQASAPEEANAQAEKLWADPDADPATRALAARMRYVALSQISSAEVRAGRLEPINLLGADKRRGRELKPRPPAETWRRLIAAADDYGRTYKAEDDAHASENAAGAELQAAQVQYSYDNMEEAARRFLAVIQDFPGTSHLDDAVTLYLQTFLVRGDTAGYLAAIDRVSGVVAAEAKKAADAAKGGDASAKGRAEQLARLEEQLRRQRQGAGFAAASKLLSDGKPAEAAAAFEKFAAGSPDHADAATALYNAAIAWNSAKEPKKARAVRELLLSKYPDAKVAPKATLALATDLSMAGDHAAAVQRYQQYLAQYPAAEDRCLALQNVGAELDGARKSLEAAGYYLSYATDPKCGKDDPNNAAKVLYRAAAIFNKAGKRAETQQALKALVGLSGVTDPVAKSYVDDARSRVK